MRTLVTGAAGFIGSTLVDRLLREGHEVVGVDDFSRGSRANLQAAGETSRFELLELDVTTPAFVDAVGRCRPEIVFHLAAQIDVRISVADPLLDARLNVLGTVNVCEAARLADVGKVVFTSSGGSIYGSPTRLPVSEQHPVDPESPYAAAKAAGEIYLGAYGHMYGLRSTSLALANVYGPRQDPHGEAGVVAIFGTAMLEGRPTRIFGDGTATRDYVFVEDVVDAYLRVIGQGDGHRFNIGTGVETSVRDLHSIVASATGAPDEPEMAAARTGELQAIALDASAARDDLGWAAATDLTTGVERTVDWLRTTLSRGP
jgi:UDP-glucose 4-epimerase